MPCRTLLRCRSLGCSCARAPIGVPGNQHSKGREFDHDEAISVAPIGASPSPLPQAQPSQTRGSGKDVQTLPQRSFSTVQIHRPHITGIRAVNTAVKDFGDTAHPELTGADPAIGHYLRSLYERTAKTVATVSLQPRVARSSESSLTVLIRAPGNEVDPLPLGGKSLFLLPPHGTLQGTLDQRILRDAWTNAWTNASTRLGEPRIPIGTASVALPASQQPLTHFATLTLGLLGILTFTGYCSTLTHLRPLVWLLLGFLIGCPLEEECRVSTDRRRI